MNKNLYKICKNAMIVAVALFAGASFVACSDDNDDPNVLAVAFNSQLPEGVSIDDVTSAILNLHELNTGADYTVNPLSAEMAAIPLGVYDYNGTMKITATADDGTTIEKTLRTVGHSVNITADTRLSLDWFFSNPGGTLVISEIYTTGSLNAKGTGGLYDGYFVIYNNSDKVVYADGIGFCESQLNNEVSSDYEILTAANDREANFTARAIYVIPGKGTDYPLQPGESLKIADQAIDWSAQLPHALNHTDADFEWYDEHKLDTDNPDVPNLDKWFSYSATIFLMDNQSRRSYALIKFPEGMTAEQYVAEYDGTYNYINAKTGTTMTQSKVKLVPYEWIIDGVNLCNDAEWFRGALSKTVDISYASISDIKSDPNRFGRAFRRKVATEVDGRKILQDTNDSAADFERVVVSSAQ